MRLLPLLTGTHKVKFATHPHTGAILLSADCHNDQLSALRRFSVTQKIILYAVIAVLLILAGALITGQFDIHPLTGIAMALTIVVLAAVAIRKKRD